MTQGLAIVVFHRVLPARDELLSRTSTVEEFRDQMQTLKRFFRPVPLSEGLRDLQAGRLRRRSVAVTFDDGYADNARLALPVLQEFQVPATFFIATGFLGGGRMWNDTVIEVVRSLPAGRYEVPATGIKVLELTSDADRGPLVKSLLASIKHLEPARRQVAVDALAALTGDSLSRDLMMEPDDVRRLAAAGMEVGGHTRSHPILSMLSAQEAEREILGGLDDLRAIVGRPVTLFAYPNGRRNQDFGDREVSILERSGVEFAFASNRGVARRNSHRLQLPRLNPLHRAPIKFGYALWRAYREPEWDWRSAGPA